MYASTMMAELLDYMKISVEEIYDEDEYDANTKFSDGAEYWIEVKDANNIELQ